MKIKTRFNIIASLLFCSFILILSCEPEVDIDPDGVVNNPGNGNNNSPNPDPDVLSQHLLLDSASQVSGPPPAAPDGQLKIDVQDTIFLMKGYRLGNRIRILHDSTLAVSGFNIYIPGATYYYDVPEDITEGQYEAQGSSDTTSVVEIDLDLPEDEIEYPFTTEIIIQPHDPAGTVLDEFTRYITIEDPEASTNCNSILEKTWEWNFSIRVQNGEILNVWAPALGIPINFKGGGCCGASGKSYTVADIQCVEDIHTATMSWIEVYPNDYYVRPFEIIHFYNGGKALAFQKEIIKNWDLSNTDFCSQNLAYTITVNDNFAREGTHDFVAGATHMTLSFPDWKGGWRPRGGNIVYTCNMLVIITGGEDAIFTIYKEWDGFSLITNTQVIWHD